jgi:hypothetical protein
MHELRSSCRGRPGGRRTALGNDRARHQARGGVAAACLADRDPVRPGRRDPAGGPPFPAARRVQPGHPGVGCRGVRRHDPGPERGRHADERHARGAARRRHASPGRDHRGGAAAQRGAPGRLGGLRRVAGRCRPRGRGRTRRRRDDERRWPDRRVAAALVVLHGGADSAAGGSRPGRGDGAAVPGRDGGRAACRDRDRGPADGRRGGARPARHRRPRAGRHARAVHAVRLRPGSRLGRDRRDLPQPGAAGRGGSRGRGLR